MLEASRRLAPVACLLSLLLVWASVDRVADAPALNPHSSDLKGLCCFHVVDVLTDHAGGPGLRSAAALRPLWFAAPMPLSEAGMSVSCFPAMQHASDLSPPFSLSFHS
jgi:hypothetical protein